ncbi:MAG: SixA phosphatase family protein [Streptosporangiales bacterium]
MARVLVLVRHATAGQAPGAPDIDRPLTEAGTKLAREAGEWLHASGVRPDTVICSTATRARQTWEAMQSVVSEPLPAVSYDRRVYEGDVDGLIRLVAEDAADAETLALVGHNPTMHALVGELTGAGLERFPAGTVALLHVPVEWVDLTSGSATLRDVSQLY